MKKILLKNIGESFFRILNQFFTKIESTLIQKTKFRIKLEKKPKKERYSPCLGS